jgi:hypothetical protein
MATDPISIASRPGTGGDEIMMAMTFNDGSINAFWDVVPDLPAPTQMNDTVNLDWNTSQIAGPRSGAGTPFVAFGARDSTHVAVTGFPGNSIVYYFKGLQFFRPGSPPAPEYTPLIIPNATGSVYGLAIMPDGNAFILTVSSPPWGS